MIKNLEGINTDKKFVLWKPHTSTTWFTFYFLLYLETCSELVRDENVRRKKYRNSMMLMRSRVLKTFRTLEHISLHHWNINTALFNFVLQYSLKFCCPSLPF